MELAECCQKTERKSEPGMMVYSTSQRSQTWADFRRYLRRFCKKKVILYEFAGELRGRGKGE